MEKKETKTQTKFRRDMKYVRSRSRVLKKSYRPTVVPGRASAKPTRDRVSSSLRLSQSFASLREISARPVAEKGEERAET